MNSFTVQYFEFKLHVEHLEDWHSINHIMTGYTT